MVDTLVLGTSANAWEFESLHAQTKKGSGQKSGPFLVEHRYKFSGQCILRLK